MSATRQKAASSRWRAIAAYAAPTLILLAIVVRELRFYEYNMLRPESLIVLGAAIAIGVAVGALSRLRPDTLGPLLMAVTLGIYVLYRQGIVDRVTDAADAVSGVIGFHDVVLGLITAALFLVICFVCWLMREHIATIASVAFGTIVLASIVLPAKTNGEAISAGALPTHLNDLPPVVHIVLDEHIGLDAMPREMDESADAIREINATYEDFAVYGAAYSRFAETQNSLASMMNDELNGDVLQLLDKHSNGYTLRESAWFDALKARGYAIRVYQTPWIDLCELKSVDTCYTYPINSPNAAQRTDLSLLGRLHLLLSKLGLAKGHPFPAGPATIEALHRMEADMAQTPRGVAYFAHLLLPHYDYQYDSNCRLADPADWHTVPGHQEKTVTPQMRRAAYGFYLQQVRCSNRLMGELFEAMKMLGVYDDATIVVHGDHGSRISAIYSGAPAAEFSNRNLLDYFAALLAVKAPGTKSGVHHEPVLLQHFFAQTFLGSDDEAPPSGEVLLREGSEEFASRILRWPDETPGVGVSVGDMTSLRPSIEETKVH
jgi:hypothetical protein